MNELLNKRIAIYLKGYFEEPRHKDLKGMYYIGGTLCLDILFWKGTEDTKVMEIFLLNLDGRGNSTIYGDFKMTPENIESVKKIYLDSKGETSYYRKSTGLDS